MTEIIDEILKDLPEGKISEVNFEGANIVLYTKDKDFLFNNGGIIRTIVNKLKKRVELRPDPSICIDPDTAKDEIKKIVPEETGIANITFLKAGDHRIVGFDSGPGNCLMDAWSRESKIGEEKDSLH